jgi:hypothetical protein
MSNISLKLPLPPHALVRPSLLAVGPFHMDSIVTRQINHFFGTFLTLRQRLPSLTLFLLGKGAHFCFSSFGVPGLNLVEYETLPFEYIVYGNLLLDFNGKEQLQIDSLRFAKEIGCPTIQPIRSKLPFLRGRRNQQSEKILEDDILTVLNSSSFSLGKRFENIALMDLSHEEN